MWKFYCLFYFVVVSAQLDSIDVYSMTCSKGKPINTVSHQKELDCSAPLLLENFWLDDFAQLYPGVYNPLRQEILLHRSTKSATKSIL